MKFGLPNETVFPRHIDFNSSIVVYTAAANGVRVVWWSYKDQWHAFDMKDNDRLRALDTSALRDEYLKTNRTPNGIAPICKAGDEIALLGVLLHLINLGR